jgi:hypothetical protein
MAINWHKIRNIKKLKQQRAKRQDTCFDDHRAAYEDNRHFADALPLEAADMSRRGRAKGFDPIWFGRAWTGEIPAIAEVTKKGVQFLVLSDDEKAWIVEAEGDNARWKARKQVIRNRNFTSWESISKANHEFLLSLIWIPVDPYNAMEILARAAR